MSDLADLDGIFPTSIRWNAEEGILGISVRNPETGEREIQEIPLGAEATFAMDLLTRVRGYGLIRVGLYDMKLTPVGTPPPPRFHEATRRAVRRYRARTCRPGAATVAIATQRKDTPATPTSSAAAGQGVPDCRSSQSDSSGVTPPAMAET